MAQNLINGVINMYKLTDGLSVIGSNSPSGDVGFNKQEDGFYLHSLKSVTIWYKYSIGGWQEFINIDSNDEDFNNGFIDGGMFVWTDHETHGNVEAAYIQTSESSHEIRLFIVDDNVITDYEPGDGDFDTRFVSFNGDTVLVGGKISDGDGFVKVIHDLTGYEAGDDYTTNITIGSTDKVISFMDRFKNMFSTYSYNQTTGETTISFKVPEVKNDKSRFHSYVSLEESGVSPGSLPTVTTGMKMTVTVGDRTIGDGSLRYILPIKGTFTVDWGDSSSVEQYDNINIEGAVAHTYATAGDYQITLENADISNMQNIPAYGYRYYFTGGAGFSANHYNESLDTLNEGPIAFEGGKWVTHLNLDTVDSVIFEDPADLSQGQIMKIVDSTGKNWADVFNLTDSKYNDVTNSTMQVGGAGGMGFSKYTATFDAGTNTTTVQLDHGQFNYHHGGILSNRVSADWYGSSKTSNLVKLYFYADPNGNANQQAWASAKGSFFDSVAECPRYLDSHKIKSIDRWGDVNWQSNSAVSAFHSAIHMDILATDSPDWSNVTNLSNAFLSCKSLKDLNNSLSNANVCTSNVTNLSSMFRDCLVFQNTDLSSWDVRNVTSFAFMFYNNRLFNGNIDNWVLSSDSSKTITFNQFFRGALLFNRNINTKQNSNGEIAWDTVRVRLMQLMFCDCSSFDQPLDKWNTSLNVSTYLMFGADSRTPKQVMKFNQDINTTYVQVGSKSYVAWDMSNNKSTVHMFKDNQHFNKAIDNWNTSNIESFSGMFWGAKRFDQAINTASKTVNGVTYTAWDVAGSNIFGEMFYNAHSFNQPINNWNISARADYLTSQSTSDVATVQIKKMFANAYSFNQDINTQTVTVGGVTYTAWDVSKVTNTVSLFAKAVSFNQSLSNWDISFLYNARYMFDGAYSFNQDLSSWATNGNGTSSLGYCGYMFTDMGEMTYGNSFTNWDMSNCIETFMMFAYRSYRNNSWPTGAVTAYLDEWLGSGHGKIKGKLYDLVDENGNLLETVRQYPFAPDVSNWNLSNVKSAASMFRGGAVDFNPDLSNWASNTWSNLVERGTSNPGVLVENNTWGWGISSMFAGCHGFEGIGLNNWNTGNILETVGLFQETNINSSVLASWDVRNLTHAKNMFAICNKGNFTGNLDLWKPISLRNASYMFATCTDFVGNISQWPTPSLVNCTSMFSNATSFDSDISTKNNVYTDPDSGAVYSAWDMSNVTTIAGMFNANQGLYGHHKFNQPIGNWDTSSLIDMQNFLVGTVFNQDLSNWSVSQVVQFQNVNSSHNLYVGPIGSSNSVLSTSNYDSILVSWAADVQANGTAINTLKPKVGFGNAKYTTGGDAEAARNSLINAGWNIQDGGAA